MKTHEAAPHGARGEPKLGLLAVSSFVVANMVGTGVFTSLGFQLLGISNQWVLLSLWLLGGVLAFCGALMYAELGSVMPRSGGEYNFLSRLFHPCVGFVAGWISLTVGFAAPVAATCMALGKYAHGALPGLSPEVTAMAALVGITSIHSFSVALGGWWQTAVTLIKVLLIVVFIVAGMTLAPNPQPFATTVDWAALCSAPYAISLVWVMFAYSGWNAATYIIGDIANPKKNLTPALLVSTLSVTVLFVLLNAVFLYTTPEKLLAGQIEIGNIAAVAIFGAEGGRLMSGVIAVLLVSSISAMVYVGPRVAQAMGEDVHLLRALAKTTGRGVPLRALWMQCGFSLLLIVTASFDQIINFSGFVLNVCSLAVAVGLFVHRAQHPDMERPFRTWGYPVTPLVFIGLILWTLIYLVLEKPVEALCGTGVIVFGLLIYGANALTKKTAALVVFCVLFAGVSLGTAGTARATSNNDEVFAQRNGNTLNQTARLVAGINLPSDTLFPAVRNSAAWQAYAKESDEVWAAYYKKNNALVQWVLREVHPVTVGVPSLFYPFSGPDFLYANLFFPDAQEIYAIGLEKVGTVPEFDETSSNTLIDASIAAYKTSINEVMRSSYYRTGKMMGYLNTEAVDGVIPVVMLFMARANMDLTAITYVSLDEAGGIIEVPAEELAGRKNRGVEFRYFMANDTQERRLVYFSLNMEDNILKRNPTATAFLQSLRTQASFAKAASYLMHYSSFSTVREAILANCNLVISEDSGIPFKAYDPAIWQVQLYGSYKGCIPDFKHIFETDLAAAYADTARDIRPLGFRIGYSYPSNMRIAVRK